MLQSVLLAPPKVVDLGVIEQELVQLWKKAGETTALTGAPVVRACTLNLVIFTEGPERTAGLEEIVSQITVDHPGRIFLISADRGSTSSNIDTWVSARCSIPVRGGQQVCCEEINITASGAEASRIPSIVTSLLVPDIPTILLWRAKLDRQDGILNTLAQVAERVLIDSSEELHPVESLSAWSRFIDQRRDRTACGDLAWTHIVPWRRLLAQAFQPPSRRAYLTILDRVTMEYTASHDPVHSGLSQSLLAAGWLSSALGWVPVHPFHEEGERSLIAELKQAEQTVTILIKEVPQTGVRPGGIESIALHSEEGGNIALRSVAGREDCILLRVSWPGSPVTEDVLMVPHHTEAELVSNELEVLYNDSMFESSMDMFARLVMPGNP